MHVNVCRGGYRRDENFDARVHVARDERRFWSGEAAFLNFLPRL